MLVDKVRPLLTAGLPLLCLVSTAASGQSTTDQDRAFAVYECAGALTYGEGIGKKYQISSQSILAEFEALANARKIQKDPVDAAVRRHWFQQTKGQGPGAMNQHILSLARDCEKKYLKILGKPAVSQKRKPGTYNTTDLRYHISQTGDYAAVADYIVHKYPRGKNHFSQIAEGEYLGEIIAKIGRKGVKKFSDAAVVGIVKQHYWQYNPPASLIIDAEYRRRLQVKKYNEAQAQQWARRAQQAREQRAQAGVYASPSIGKARTVFQTCTRTTYSGYGGGSTLECKTHN